MNTFNGQLFVVCARPPPLSSRLLTQACGCYDTLSWCQLDFPSLILHETATTIVMCKSIRKSREGGDDEQFHTQIPPHLTKHRNLGCPSSLAEKKSIHGRQGKVIRLAPLTDLTISLLCTLSRPWCMCISADGVPVCCCCCCCCEKAAATYKKFVGLCDTENNAQHQF